MTAFKVYDVFTDKRFGGNQLAVIPDASQIAEDDLQRIAREFNFSETTFVYRPKDPANTAKVRIFTPTMEIQFAGHPIVGTATCLADLGHPHDMVLELGVGPIPCKIAGNDVSFTTSARLERIAHPDVNLVAQALGLPPKAIATHNHPPIQASIGLPFVVTELVDRASLRDCAPNMDGFRAGSAKYPAGLDFAIFAYCGVTEIDARMFAPLDNIPEDPATGSACATLAALLHEDRGGAQTLQITQGEDMGRRSSIYATTAGTPPAVTISGRAVLAMEGKLAD